MATEQWRAAWSTLHDGEEAAVWGVTPGEGEDTWSVLGIRPEQGSREAAMPAEGVLSEAPLGDYDVIELSVFAHPVARVRWCVDETEGVGGLSEVQRWGDSELGDDAVIPVLVEAALDELWQAGAETVTTLVPSPLSALYVRAGWEVIATVARG